MKVRSAVEGTELSTECVVFRFESFSISGARISGGSLRVKEPRLKALRQH